MTTVQEPPKAERTAAPARHSAPVDAVQERLDEPVVLVPGMVRVLLAAVLVAVAGVVVWLIAGTWPRHVDVPGVLAHGTGPAPVVAPVDGTVTSVRVAVGSTVTAGSPIAAISTTTGGVTVVDAPAGGIVAALRVHSGDAVRPGTPLVSLDDPAAATTAYLLVTKDADLARLDLGQRVEFAVQGRTVTGRISGIDPVGEKASALRERWQVPIAGLPASDDVPVWVVQVRLPSGTRAGLGSSAAVVELPSVHPYQLVFGTSR